MRVDKQHCEEDLPVSSHVERLLQFVTSPSENNWPKDCNGSGRELPLSKFIAVKPPLEFCFPEAAIHHRVLTTLGGSCSTVKAAAQLLAQEYPPPIRQAVLGTNG